MRIKIALAFVVALLCTPISAQVPKSTLNSNTATSFPDQNTGAITPAILRSYFGTLINSFQQYAGVRQVSITNDTIGLADYGQLINYNNASPIAVTLAAANGSFSTFNFYVTSTGAGAVTITPQGGSLINGSATFVLNQAQSIQIISDGTNYQVLKGFGTGTLNNVALTMPSCFAVAGSPITGTSGTFIVTMNGTQGGIPWFSSATNCGSSAALTQFGLMVGGGTGGAPSAIAAGTNGQVPLGQTGANPAMTTLSGDVASISAAGVLVNGKVNGVSQPSSGTSGGIKYFNSTSSELSSALLTANAFMIGGGVGGAPSTVAITGLVLGNGASAPTAYGGATCTNQFVRALSAAAAATCNTVNLALDVTGTLPIGNGGSSQTTALAARGSSGFNIDQATSTGDANYTILSTDRMVYHTALTAARTDTLPAANSVNAGQEFRIADFRGVATAVNTITLQRAGADTINGIASVVAVNAAFGAGIYWSDGVSRWTFFPASVGGGGGSVTQVVCGGVTITVSGTCSPYYFPPQARITLTPGTPVMQTTVAAATTVLVTPCCGGDLIPIYNGTTMIPTQFAEVSQATTDATKSPAAVAASKMYDVFCWIDAGTNRCTRGPAWTNDTTRGYTLTVTNGIPLNTSSITNGPAALRGTWVGTIRSNSGSTIDYSFGGSASGGLAAFFGVWNNYNRVNTSATITDSGAAYTYTTATIRQARASAGNQCSFVVGAQEDAAWGSYTQQIDTVAAINANVRIGLGFNNTAAFSGQFGIIIDISSSAGQEGTPTIALPWNVPVGLNVISGNERGDGSNANTINNSSTATLTCMVRN